MYGNIILKFDQYITYHALKKKIKTLAGSNLAIMFAAWEKPVYVPSSA
jgi:hypothetical protein